MHRCNEHVGDSI
jgi:hypothetical protein